ncbi:MAG TPA: hypothetical protein VNH15_04165 [Elusimicrobiota bacterium]|nr:hypothetical protein [Elusimicrobiota bacterium]
MTLSAKVGRGATTLRWIFLAGFLFYAVDFLAARPTLKTAVHAALCGLAWFFLSRKKMRELDSPKPR